MIFDELLKKEPKTEVEAIFCQAIAQLSTKEGYSHLSPWKVFDVIVEQEKETGWRK